MLFTLPLLPNNHLLIVILVLFSFINIFVNAFCPIKCHCDDSILLVDCNNGYLDLVPITLNPQLRELHLANNQIKSIKETLSFYNNLLLLDLSDNQLQSLGERNFNQLKQLKILKIGNNRLFQLNNQTFAGLINLQQLYLTHNELRNVHSDVLKPLNRLRLLDLSHNALINFHSDVFTNLIALEALDLSHNRLDNKISALIFDKLTSLKVIHLDHNSLQQLPDFLFRSLSQLYTLTLNHCELRSLNRNSFAGLENLRHLELNHNQFNQLSPDVFLYLENLEKLELQGTAFLQFPNIFKPLKAIKHLSLGHDRFLKQLAKDLFNQNVKLQSIAIEHCPSLEQLPFGLFNLQQLVLINLAQNAFSTLQSNIFSNHSTIERLILTGNPIVCDCQLSWLYSSPILSSKKLVSNQLTKKLQISREEEERLEKIFDKWLRNKESIDFNANKHYSHHKNFKQHRTHLRFNTGHQNEIDYNFGEYHDQFSNGIKFDNQNEKLNYPHKNQANELNEPNLQHSHKIQTELNDNGPTATCFEPLVFVGRSLIDLTSAELNCNNHNSIDQQSILINGEKINFENRNSEMVIGFEQQNSNNNNRDQFNQDDFLNSSTLRGLNSFTLCFISVFSICLVLFVILFSYIYFKRHRKQHHQPISSWILKKSDDRSNNATLSFQPFAAFDMNQEHLNQSPKCNTLVNPLAKLGPLPKKPINSSTLINQNNLLITNSLNSSPANMDLSYNSTLSSNIKLTPQITRISNLTNSSSLSNSLEMNTSKLYEQVDYSKFGEQIYEDPLVDDLNTTNNYGYQQLNSTTSTSSSYLSNCLNQNPNQPPSTYEEFLAIALMRNAKDDSSYGTLNSQATTNRLSNINNLNRSNINFDSINNINNFNFNRINSRRTMNSSIVHL